MVCGQADPLPCPPAQRRLRLVQGTRILRGAALSLQYVLIRVPASTEEKSRHGRWAALRCLGGRPRGRSLLRMRAHLICRLEAWLSPSTKGCCTPSALSVWGAPFSTANPRRAAAAAAAAVGGAARMALPAQCGFSVSRVCSRTERVVEVARQWCVVYALTCLTPG